MTPQIDEIRLQRLVDGALNEDERREFLVSLDRTSAVWREVALAFVEDQIFHSELGTGRHSRSMTASAKVLPRTSATPYLSIVLGIAVSLLAMFGIGFLWGQWQTATPTPSVPPRIVTAGNVELETEVGETDDAEEPRDASPDAEPAYRMMLAHEGGEAVELPVYERSQLADLPWEQADMGRFRRLSETLVQRGYRADLRTEYLSGHLEDGRQIVVPCRMVSLMYDAQ